MSKQYVKKNPQITKGLYFSNLNTVINKSYFPIILQDDIIQMNKFQRTTFEVPGDIARVELNFLRGARGRVRIQKLYIHACKGKVQSSGGL